MAFMTNRRSGVRYLKDASEGGTYGQPLGNLIGVEGADKVGRNWGQTQAALMTQAEANLERAQSGNTVSQNQLKAGLGQAQRGMAAQAAGRGANPLAQRAAMYSGGQMAQQANTQAAALRAQEVQAAQQAYMGALSQQGQGHLANQQMDLQRRMGMMQGHQDWTQMSLNEEERERQLAFKVADTAMSVAGMAAMSDETAKRISSQPLQYNRNRVEPLPIEGEGGDDDGGMLGGILGGLSDEHVKQVAYNRVAQLGSIRRQLGEGDANPLAVEAPRVQLGGGLPSSYDLPGLIYKADEERRAERARMAELPTALDAPTPGKDLAERLRVMNDKAGAQPKGGGYMPTEDKTSRASRMMSEGQGFGSGRTVFGSEGTERQATEQELARRNMLLQAIESGELSDEGAKRAAFIRDQLDAMGGGNRLTQQPAPRVEGTPAAADRKAEAVAQQLDEAADETARKLQVYQYEYEPDLQAQGAPSGLRGGIMAQDLEDTPLGHTAVKQTPAGKALDLPQVTGLGLGLIGRQARRADELEARIGLLEQALQRGAR